MKLVVFGDYHIGVLSEAGVHDVSSVIPDWKAGDIYAMNRLIAQWATLRPAIETAASRTKPEHPSEVRLRPPVPAPMHFFAAPANFDAHLAEMRTLAAQGAQSQPKHDLTDSAETLGFFLKATGSISGPSDAIELPLNDLPDRRFDYEGEIAFIIGREAKAVSPADAINYIFGYTAVIDVTLRGTERVKEERVQRKSFASFSPMGPCITTADELDWRDTSVKLFLNGEERQHAKAGDMTVDIPNMLARASRVLPLRCGDVYTTGSPPGVGRLSSGDTLEIDAAGIGRMRIPVTVRSW